MLRLLSPLGDSGLIAVDKPAGMPTVPGRDPAQQSLRQALEAQLGRQVWVVHRLDRDTSGVVVFALDAKSHRDASMAFENSHAQKTYLAIVEGQIASEQTIDAPLMEARKRRMKVAPAGQGKPSVTVVKPLETFASASFVECVPKTGRQHQIRVHLASIGHPLLVDHQYGSREVLTSAEWNAAATGEAWALSRTPLHAARLTIASLGFSAESPLPEDMSRVLVALRVPS